MYKVKIDEKKGEIEVKVDTAADAKLAIKELRLKKKELMLQKKGTMEQQREIRAAYTEKTRNRLPAVRGGGGLGKAIRGVQSANRAGARKDLAKALEPYEKQRVHLEKVMIAIDSVILQIQQKSLT